MFVGDLFILPSVAITVKWNQSGRNVSRDIMDKRISRVTIGWRKKKNRK